MGCYPPALGRPPEPCSERSGSTAAAFVFPRGLGGIRIQWTRSAARSAPAPARPSRINPGSRNAGDRIVPFQGDAPTAVRPSENNSITTPAPLRPRPTITVMIRGFHCTGAPYRGNTSPDAAGFHSVRATTARPRPRRKMERTMVMAEAAGAADPAGRLRRTDERNAGNRLALGYELRRPNSRPAMAPAMAPTPSAIASDG